MTGEKDVLGEFRSRAGGREAGLPSKGDPTNVLSMSLLLSIMEVSSKENLSTVAIGGLFGVPLL